MEPLIARYSVDLHNANAPTFHTVYDSNKTRTNFASTILRNTSPYAGVADSCTLCHTEIAQAAWEAHKFTDTNVSDRVTVTNTELSQSWTVGGHILDTNVWDAYTAAQEEIDELGAVWRNQL